MDKIPNFFIVGFPRSGTTSMHFYLKQHPDIFMPEFKEPIYFCKDLVKESINFHKKKYISSYHITTTEKEYLKIFKKRKNEKAVGEASGWYFYSKVAAKEIKKYNPNAKIIFLIREPTELLFSLHHQYLYSGNETIKNFEKALNSENLRKKGKKINKNIPWPSLLYYSEFIKYKNHIEKFTKIFPKNQIKLVLFDDIKSNTKKVYNDLLNFLEVDPKFTPDFTVKHGCKTERFQIPYKTTLKKIFTNYFPKSLNYLLAKILAKINTKYIKRPVMNKNLRSRLKKKFKKEVIELQKLLNRDLIKLWNYDE
ncbi:sulfotransferase [Candidatus Peregrinibacteria bacterium]|nr:sulfotransferase [Candidatus Peregrinibacteria bacterium]